MQQRHFFAVSLFALYMYTCVCAVIASPLPTLDSIRQAPDAIICDNPADAANLNLVREWDGPVCRSKLVNAGKSPARVREVILFRISHSLPPDTHLYGEGFTMLSQTVGTLGHPVDTGLTDRKHYRIPQPADATTVYGLLTLQPPGGDHAIFAFTSCRKFSGRFYVRADSIEVSVDTENLSLAPGQSWDLEEFMFSSGPDRNTLLAELAQRICANHPPLELKKPPTGWCSWYCFGARVKASQILENLDWISQNLPDLRYVQLDDGYQPAMGNWLETGPAFGGGVRQVLRQIRQKHFEPAIWVAPFIAEEKSHLFQQHPDWFIHDENGKPLRADRVTFGGWRRGPWYALDGTHPGAQKFLEDLFRTMRNEWGCTYFKLDANFWGAMHGGHFHDPAATRIEAYRRGMEAIRRGAGDAFLLGCNHPVWPSFALIHGSRSSGDIRRDWKVFSKTATQNLSRNWQDGRLWWNDPDCVLLTGNLLEEEYRFHATAVFAAGGLVLSGDDLTKISPERLAMLRKMLPATGTPAQFEDDTLRVGVVQLKDQTIYCLLNWDEQPRTFTIRLPGPCQASEYWTGEEMGKCEGTITIREVPPHAGRVVVCVPVQKVRQ